MQNKEEIIKKYLEQTISKAERRQLEKWILKNPENVSYFKERIRISASRSEYIASNSNEAFEIFLKNTQSKNTGTKPPIKLLRYAAMFVGLLVASYFVFQNTLLSNDVDQEIVQQENTEIKNEIVITLADGSKQVISSTNTTSVTDVNGKVIANSASGALSFTDTENVSGNELAFNEVYIPYGEKLKIILSDKTTVWLNAGSTLKFPRNLNASTDNRMVYLNGEAFFDVTKNANKPFIVKTEGIDIKVLGTQFNVSAYNQDDAITTTLVEGAVNVSQSETPETNLLLSPDDQASFVKTDSSFKKRKVDTDIYTSWMHNRLVIDKMSFQQIMTKLERSHNVSIMNKAPELNREIFNGEFKNENIEDILKTISLSKPFTYEINQNVITITK